MNNAVEVTIRIGLLIVLAAWCFDIVRPFIVPTAWGIIIAVAVYPGYSSLVGVMGGRRVAAATLVTLLGLVLLITPAVLLSLTLVDSAQALSKSLLSGTLRVPPPPDSVLGWPLVGEGLHQFWALASDNLSDALAKVAPHLKAVATWLLSAAAGASFGILQFLIAIIIAGFLLATAPGGGKGHRETDRRRQGAGVRQSGGGDRAERGSRDPRGCPDPITVRRHRFPSSRGSRGWALGIALPDSQYGSDRRRAGRAAHRDLRPTPSPRLSS